MQLNYKIHGVLTVLLVLTGLSFYLFTPVTLFNQTLYLIFPLLATIIAFMNFKKYGLASETGRVWLWLAVGLLSWFLGEFIWYAYKYFLGLDPSISLADFFYLLAYPFLFVGLYKEYQLAKSEAKGGRKLAWLINAVALVVTALVVYFGIYKAYDPTADNLNNFFAMVYGVADLFLVFACLLVSKVSSSYQGGKFFRLWILMTAGFLVYLIGDVLYAIYREPYIEEIRPYTCIDIIWVLGYYLLSIAMLNNYFSLKLLKDKIQGIVGSLK